ncbi:MAG: hypothetical protein ACRCZI_05360 [Cetobacterium sp.]
MKTLLAIVLVFMVTACSTVAQALPTQSNTGLRFDPYTDDSATGFYVYWKKPTQADYTDAQKFSVTTAGVGSLIALAPHLPTLKGTVCFKVTAHDAANNESPFSNEACGWFNIPAPSGVGVK